MTPRRTKKGQPTDPCVVVIFGASGDLTKRKLIPALFNLVKSNLLAKQFAVIGIAREDIDSVEFRRRLTEDLKTYSGGKSGDSAIAGFIESIHYHRADFADASCYPELKRYLKSMEPGEGASNYLYYLATPPALFAGLVKNLGDVGLLQETELNFRRVIIEKPFGHDLESARTLNKDVLKTISESQIYRIDHYLGKETVQNLLIFRFANGIFEPIWNRSYIDHVQITVAESLGVERRGAYYEQAGATRDMISNHVLQLLALTAMEPPASFDADAVRDEKAKVLRAIHPFNTSAIDQVAVRGQYGEGIIDGKKVKAYRGEEKVSATSFTETYAAMKLSIDNWRWAGVPFYIRTGKRMARRVTEVVIQFKRAPFVLFRNTNVESLNPNSLVIQIQPHEAISLHFDAKVPGPVVQMGEVDMKFKYQDYFGANPSTGYETLLYDCLIGDATLFQRADNVETAWGVVGPLLEAWQRPPKAKLPNYISGSWGPAAADELIVRDGRRWRNPEN